MAPNLNADCTEVRFASFLYGEFINVIVEIQRKRNWQNAPLWIVLKDLKPSITSFATKRHLL